MLIQNSNNSTERAINKFGSQLTDLLFHSLMKMKEHGILNAHFNIPNNTITVVDPEGTLILHPNQYVVEPNTAVHYQGIQGN